HRIDQDPGEQKVGGGDEGPVLVRKSVGLLEQFRGLFQDPSGCRAAGQQVFERDRPDSPEQPAAGEALAARRVTWRPCVWRLATTALRRRNKRQRWAGN